ncbi:hypothetical protein HHE02_12410 [Helicobacter heilmannii]|nr:hypothetical protein HHE02_12410 [Helicobacter heilmannii]CRF50391.1 hypothetical protein HHE06_02160 [Helicobacter heilmannii]
MRCFDCTMMPFNSFLFLCTLFNPPAIAQVKKLGDFGINKACLS